MIAAGQPGGSMSDQLIDSTKPIAERIEDEVLAAQRQLVRIDRYTAARIVMLVGRS